MIMFYVVLYQLILLPIVKYTLLGCSNFSEPSPQTKQNHLIGGFCLEGFYMTMTKTSKQYIFIAIR